MLPPGGASPVRTATGASTGGVRMPPRAMPRSSRSDGVARDLERRRLGRRLAVDHPGPQPGDGGPQHLGLRALVDRAAQRRQVEAAAPDLAGHLGVVVEDRLVGVGGAGHLPGPQQVGVVLAGPEEAERPEQVGLGLELHHRHLEVVPDPDHALAEHEPAVAERRAAAAPAVDEEPVVDPGHRVRGVDVGDHAGARLRLAHGDDVLAVEPVEHVHVAGPADGLGRLREDVVGVGVAGVGELAVALGVPLLERLGLAAGDVDGQRGLAALDAHRLRGHADVGRPVRRGARRGRGRSRGRRRRRR